MVLRYWGFAGIRPTDFEHLVSNERGGMTADALAAEIRGFGWDVFPFPATAGEVRRHLGLGRPVISLLEVAPGRFHYVVLVGVAGERIIAHDPAGRPFELFDETGLAARWDATGGLSLLLLPPRGHPLNARAADAPARRRADAAPGPTRRCRADYDRAVAAAGAGRLREAERLLRGSDCAGSPVFRRELAGVELRRGDATAAIELAEQALAETPDDAHAARTLATALFVAERRDEALGAWNRAGEPTVDLVRIEGLRRTRYRPAARAMGLNGGDILTPRRLDLAQRRLADLPAAAVTRVEFAPTGGGRADVLAGVAERRGLTSDLLALGGLAVRAAIYRELAVTAVSPLGAGETWSAAWRWWKNRPGVRFRLDTPAEIGPPATWSVVAGWERESYALDPAPASGTETGPAIGTTPEERSVGRLEITGWLEPFLRAGGRLGYARWVDRGGFLSAGASAEIRTTGDHLSVELDGDGWLPAGGNDGFWTASAGIRATTNPRPEGLVALGRAYVRAAGSDAPATLWPGAGGGVARPDLLRAHSLLDDGRMAGKAFDRRLAGGGVEIVRWLSIATGVRLAPAAFLDVARAWGDRPSVFLADAGGGVRLTGVGGGPVLRLDVAFGLSDDDWAISAALSPR